MIQRTVKGGLVLLSLGALALTFQNCSEGFVLTPESLELASSLNPPGVGGGGNYSDPVTCRTDGVPQRAPVRLLSNTEYDNIASDIFYSSIKPSADAKFVVSEAGPSGFSNTSISSHPNAPTINSAMAEKFWTAATLIADEVIQKKSQAGFFANYASCANQATVTESCYDSIVRNVGLRVWRRPVTEGTNSEFARLKDILKKGANFDQGFKDLLKALLISPNFLAVSWTPNTNVAPGAAFNLNDYQLASRLSFFLWQSAPDQELLNLAKSGTLSSATNLQNQVIRMLNDPKGKRFASIMANEWLGTNQLLGLGLTTINAATLNAMLRETQLMFEDIVTNNSSFLNLLSADYSFLNKTLADYYGVAFNGSDPNQFVKTNMTSTPRRGVISHASFLVTTAGAPNETHPVTRGKAVALKFGCYEIAPPPADLDLTLPSDIPANSTPREILTAHTSKSSCIGCHQVLNPYGFAMESFDQKGHWRSTYPAIANRPIDSSGALPSGERFTDTKDFMATLTSSENVKSCLVRHVMSLGLARKVASADDRCNAKSISQVAMNPDSKLSDLITNIVTSRQFKMQSTEAQ